jgi:glutathione S-transferase
MFAPVVLRFRTYRPELPAAATAYCAAVLQLPAVIEWCAAADEEQHRIDQYER